ncbi:MAG: ABC transporter ATP-binding protein, partial [Gaiellales bacterium]
LLTTHYLEEAHQLADRIAILRDGEIVASGAPHELLSTNGSVRIRFRRDGETIVLDTDEPTRVLNELTGEALAAGLELEGLVVERQSLEDLYIELTEEDS